MKEKLLTVFLAAASVAACAFGLAACGEQDSQPSDAGGHTHDWGQWQILEQSDCAHTVEERYCETCGEHEERTVAYDHEWEPWYTLTEPTCESEGVQERECMVCHYSEQQSIPVTEHTWGEWYPASENPPTCTEAGTEERECFVCGETETRTAEAYGHDTFFMEEVEATCTNTGHTDQYRCSRCGEYFSDEQATIPLSDGDRIIPATGHSYSDRWESNEYAHWHPATCEHTNAQGSYAPHNMVAYDSYEECSDCGYPIDHTGSIENVNTTTDGNGVRTFHMGISSSNPSSVWAIDFSGYAFPTGVQVALATNAFRECKNLKVIDFSGLAAGNPLVAIGRGAFEGTALKEIVIPATVTSIGDSAFNGCASLESVTFEEGSKLESLGALAFGSCTSLKQIALPSGIDTIEQSLFNGCTSLTEVTIPAGVTSINESAFRGCTALESIVIPDGVTSIGDNAFYGCTALKSIVLPDSLISIGDNAFYGCTALESADLGSGLTDLGEAAFSGCSLLKEIEIPEGVATIPARAFMDCSSLAKVTLPESLTEVVEYAFSGCSSLAAIYYGGNVEDWCAVTGVEYILRYVYAADERSLYFNDAFVSGGLVIP